MALRAGGILEREKAPWDQRLLKVPCLLSLLYPVSHIAQFMALSCAIGQTGSPDAPLPVFLNGLQFKQDHTDGSQRSPNIQLSSVQPYLGYKTLSHLELILEPCRITVDARTDALVCFKGQFNFDAFGLNSCFLISRNCSQFSSCQLTALCTSPLPAYCAITSLPSLITLACSGWRGKRETCTGCSTTQLKEAT